MTPLKIFIERTFTGYCSKESEYKVEVEAIGPFSSVKLAVAYHERTKEIALPKAMLHYQIATRITKVPNDTPSGQVYRFTRYIPNVRVVNHLAALLIRNAKVKAASVAKAQ